MKVIARLPLAVAALVLIGANTAAQAQSAPKLWSTTNASSSGCSSFSSTYGAEKFNTTVQGHKWPNTPGGGVEFISHSAAHLNAAARGRASDEKLKARLLTASRGNAFTRLDFEGPGGSSPAFVSAIITKSVAYSVSYLRSRGKLSPDELREIDRWVGVLRKNARKKANSKDHKMALASSDVMWTAAIGDSRGFKTAASKFQRAAKSFDRQGRFSSDIRNNNEVMHHVVGAAAVLRLNGYDALGLQSKGLTLYDAVGRHAANVSANGSKKVKTSGDPSDQARSIMRAQGWGTHLAWIPVFLAIAPPGEARQAVVDLDRQLRKSDRKPYWGRQMGIHTGCLFGRN